MLFILLFLGYFELFEGKGLSRSKANFNLNVRRDSPISDLSCKLPSFAHLLPAKIRSKVELVWSGVGDTEDCWVELARTRNLLLRLTTEERNKISKSYNPCKPAPRELKSRNQLKERYECWKEYKKNRLLLLNKPIVARRKVVVQPPVFNCELPHFYERLEAGLKDQLLKVWTNYKKGTPCPEEIERQLQILEANEISLHSFQMPPAELFTRERLLKKLKGAAVA